MHKPARGEGHHHRLRPGDPNTSSLARHREPASSRPEHQMATISNPTWGRDHGQGDERGEQGDEEERRHVGSSTRSRAGPGRTIAPTQAPRVRSIRNAPKPVAASDGRSAFIGGALIGQRDDGVVEEREHPRVQLLDVGVEGVDEIRRRGLAAAAAATGCSRSCRRDRRSDIRSARSVKPLASTRYCSVSGCSGQTCVMSRMKLSKNAIQHAGLSVSSTMRRARAAACGTRARGTAAGRPARRCSTTCAANRPPSDASAERAR